MLQTRNSKYFVVSEGKELGYYLDIEFGHVKLIVKPMPVKAKVENEAGLLQWVEATVEEDETTDSE